MDLWHSLKVPNETDLLKDLASGMSGSLRHILILTARNRGVTGHCCRGRDSENWTDKEEGDVIRPTFVITD